MRFQGKIPSSRGRSYDGNIMRECWSLSDIVSPKNFRYLDFGITSFNFRFFGINKNYLLIIKKFITRFNYNF